MMDLSENKRTASLATSIEDGGAFVSRQVGNLRDRGSMRPASQTKATLDSLWGLVTGLLVGAGVFGHALRLVVLGTERFVGRHAIAGFAVLLYGVAATLAFFRHKSGLWIAVLGPAGGITAVTLAPNAHVDTFQMVLGVPQMMALALSVYLLRTKD